MIEVLPRTTCRWSEKINCVFIVNPLTGQRIDNNVISIKQNVKFIGFEI